MGSKGISYNLRTSAQGHEARTGERRTDGICAVHTLHRFHATYHISEVSALIQLLRDGKYIKENGISTYHEYKYLLEFRLACSGAYHHAYRFDECSTPTLNHTLLDIGTTFHSTGRWS